MKHIRSAIAGGLLVFGTAAVASSQTAQTAPRAQGQHQKWGHRRGPGAEKALFRGISLSDAEKANLKTVRAKYAPQMKALREQFKTQAQSQGKIARGDTAAMRARREANAPQRAQLEKLMQSERADLRAALTPANQAKFDANVQQVKQRMANRAAKGKGKFAGRGQ